ncbi:MAG: extracellular solute-binding protein, partial [Candidatus Rokubacteria bacterium]|nr:extracellular solute-binding protein [Candidatus Rokubacteria bacterium]
MSRLSRRVLTLALISLLAAVASVTAASARNGSAKDVTLTFWHTMNTQETVTLNDLVKQFEAAHSGIKVDVVSVPFDQRDTKFTAAAQAGQAPDV